MSGVHVIVLHMHSDVLTLTRSFVSGIVDECDVEESRASRMVYVVFN